jgi:hypothetical protein
MKFCPAVPEICRAQVHASRKERIRIIIIKIIIRNGAKTISLQKGVKAILLGVQRGWGLL